MALLRHSTVFYGIINKPTISKAYTVTFAEQPSTDSLDTCGDKWLNVQSMILPSVKFVYPLSCTLFF